MAEWPYYTVNWQRLRRAKLATAPLCEACGLRGKLVLANAVDHITAISAGGDAFPPLNGLMSLCTPCHSEKTAAMDRAGGKGVRFKGAGLLGMPIDPQHPFFQGSGAAKPVKKRVYPLSKRQSGRKGPTSEGRVDLVSAENCSKSANPEGEGGKNG